MFVLRLIINSGFMKQIYLLTCGLLLTITTVYSQEMSKNTADILMAQESKMSLGGYAEIDYNQPLSGDLRKNGKLDIHRLVLFYNYKFSKNTQFVTEIEYEHVKEVFIEQAFLNHRISKAVNLRAGLLLIPMGIVNEYHEPTTFNGVERPVIDKVIVPTTWREIGLGITGRSDRLLTKYQVYIVDGLKSYDNGEGLLGGKNGIRSGRQKGAEAMISSPNLSVKLDHYGLKNTKIGLAGYFGKTQSSLYNNLRRDDDLKKSQADSSVVSMSMVGLDIQYAKSKFRARGQLNYAHYGNTEEYNRFTGQDLGNQALGYYAEVSYNVLSDKASTELYPFVRYQHYNLHQGVAGDITKNPNYNVNDITTGLTYNLGSGVSLKMDYQFIRNELKEKSDQFNMGVHVWFN